MSRGAQASYRGPRILLNGERIAHKCNVIAAVRRLALVLLLSPALQAYSVLTHEAIIDSAWDGNIKPLILKRFPQTTPDQLTEAHGYSYAGCILQDMGYYPFGSKFFSDLVHYVRTGDFVMNLIRDSEDVDEYAFALGALAHYAADTEGHSIAVNRSVPIEYPKLKRKYGPVVTYAEDESAHIKVEFGFDVLQVARGNYAPQSYHDFIGFAVSKPVLERAFHDTYGLDLTDVFGDLDLALRTYRHTVSSLIPEATRVAWQMKKKDLEKTNPRITKRKFIYNLRRASYQKEWKGEYRKPGIGARILAFVLRILPKVGPLKALAFKAPTPQTDQLFQTSFNKTLDVYRGFLRDQGDGDLTLQNRDFDTGALTRPTEYSLADETYAKLAVKLAERNPDDVNPRMRANILDFFRDPQLAYATKKDPKEWAATTAALDKLKGETLNTASTRSSVQAPQY